MLKYSILSQSFSPLPNCVQPNYCLGPWVDHKKNLRGPGMIDGRGTNNNLITKDLKIDSETQLHL